MRRNTKHQSIVTGALLLILMATPLLADLPWGSPATGEKGTVSGIVTATGPGVVTVVNRWGRTVRIVYDKDTTFEELKRNFFRQPTPYSPRNLVSGLELTAQGQGDAAGNLVASSVKFTQDALRIAQSLQTRVAPLEAGLNSTDRDVAAVKRDLDGARNQMGAQVGDLRAGIRAVGQKTGVALERAEAALESGVEAHHRVGDIADYRELGILTVGFGFNSAELGDDARLSLDSLVEDVEMESGYLLEVSGFASADGNDAHNRRLSQNRAHQVIRYLVEVHQLPRQRILAPYGFGESLPLGDNDLLEGRQQNRRVEIRVLINMGIQPSREPAG